MTFSLFSRARRSTTEIARLESQPQRESGEFVDGPVELTAAELRLVAGAAHPPSTGSGVAPAPPPPPPRLPAHPVPDPPQSVPGPGPSLHAAWLARLTLIGSWGVGGSRRHPLFFSGVHSDGHLLCVPSPLRANRTEMRQMSSYQGEAGHAGAVAASSSDRKRSAASADVPHISGPGASEPHTAGRRGSPNSRHRRRSSR